MIFILEVYLALNLTINLIMLLALIIGLLSGDDEENELAKGTYSEWFNIKNLCIGEMLFLYVLFFPLTIILGVIKIFVKICSIRPFK